MAFGRKYLQTNMIANCQDEFLLWVGPPCSQKKCISDFEFSQGHLRRYSKSKLHHLKDLPFWQIHICLLLWIFDIIVIFLYVFDISSIMIVFKKWFFPPQNVKSKPFRQTTSLVCWGKCPNGKITEKGHFVKLQKCKMPFQLFRSKMHFVIWSAIVW